MWWVVDEERERVRERESCVRKGRRTNKLSFYKRTERWYVSSEIRPKAGVASEKGR